MQLLLNLLLAHLVADYLLQPLSLVNWKNRSLLGLAMHVFIHLFIYLIIGGYYLGLTQILPIALAISAFHFVIDLIKCHSEKTTKNFFLTYWIDQIAHYLTIIIIVWLSGQHTPQYVIFLDQPALVIFGCLSIFFTLAIEFGEMQKRRKKGPIISIPLNWRAMFKRLFILAILYLGIVLVYSSQI